MKKLLTLIAIVTIMIMSAKAQDGWIIKKLDQHIAVKFPGEIKTLFAGAFGAAAKDSVLCTVSILDFLKDSGIDSVKMAQAKEMPAFANALKSSLISNAKYHDISNLVLGHLQGLTSYSATAFDADNRKNSILLLIYGSNIYFFLVKEYGKSSSKTKDDFFNSIVVTN